MYYLGIDLGGTNIAAAAVSEDGEILAAHSTPTPRDTDVPNRVAATIVQAAKIAVEKAGLSLSDAHAMGIGSPGVIDPISGTVVYWSNLDFNHVPLVSLIRAHLDTPLEIYLENDANAAALGEFAVGAGRDADSMVAITLGTGVGGGAIFGGKLFTGFNYGGMEVGHFSVESTGRKCTCGRPGCFEVYCSATALIRSTKEAMEQHPESTMWKLVEGDIAKVNGRTSFDGKEQGDPTAIAVLDEYFTYLGGGITSLINILQPEVFCVGGGISNQGEKLMAPLRDIVDAQDYCRDLPRRCRLMRAELGNDAGIIGAALLPKFR